MMIIHNYNEDTDAVQVGILIAESYRKYNPDFAPPEEYQKLLGPFRYARSREPAHQDEIARVWRVEYEKEFCHGTNIAIPCDVYSNSSLATDRVFFILDIPATRTDPQAGYSDTWFVQTGRGIRSEYSG